MNDTTSVPGDPSLDRSEPVYDRVFEALSDEERRHVLDVLADANPRTEAEFAPAELAAATDDFAAFERRLVHVHLPKLAEGGYVEWDRETHTVTRGPNFEEIAPLVALFREHEAELPGSWP